MVLPETAIGSAASIEALTLEQPAGASGTRLKVAARPATVGATWMDLFHPGTHLLKVVERQRCVRRSRSQITGIDIGWMEIRVDGDEIKDGIASFDLAAHYLERGIF